MSSRLFAAAVAALSIGCTRLMEIHPNGDRIWLMTEGGRHVYRCYDMTAPGALPTVRPTVFCKDADLIDREGRHDGRAFVSSSTAVVTEPPTAPR